MLSKYENRRRFSRVDIRTPIKYQIRGKCTFSNGISEDISAGGLAISNADFIPTGIPLMLEINILARILRPIGKVAWVCPLPHCDKNRLGIEFIEMDPGEKNYLADYVAMRKDQLQTSGKE